MEHRGSYLCETLLVAADCIAPSSHEVDGALLLVNATDGAKIDDHGAAH